MADDFKDFNSIVAEILRQTKLTRDQVMALIQAKQNGLIVTSEGAAGMVAEELGVKVDG